MPLYKVESGKDRQVIQPRTWTMVNFLGQTEFALEGKEWTLIGVLLRVDYPSRGTPRTLKGRFARWPDSSREDLTGFDDKDPIPGQTRHHYWSHFVLNQPDLTMGFKLWHDGKSPIVLDGRQFKYTSFS